MRLFAFLNGFWGKEKPAVVESAYHAFTKQFDRIVAAGNLDSVFGAPDADSKASLEAAWEEYRHGIAGWKIRTGFKTMEFAAALSAQLPQEDRVDAIVCVLMDQSGSMCGPKMLMTAMAMDILQACLIGIGVRCEILGFTTFGWHGGQSRALWKKRGRPANPGRLCDLLHIVYKSADDLRDGTDGWFIRDMLRPDLPKENVDGEALEWAVSRLRSRQEKRKILLVISDGAPVDDSTLLENGLNYLHQHLETVLTEVTEAGDIAVCAVGLGYNVDRYYRTSAKASVPDDLPEAMLRVLQTAFTVGLDSK